VQRQALSREVVDDHQGADGTAVLDAVMHEIARPPLVRPARRIDEVAANVVDLLIDRRDR
jgi:hypothetical protein